MGRPPTFPLRVGCIDIGSNAIRAVAAEFTDATEHKILVQERAPVRLGRSVFLDGAIDAEAMQLAVASIAEFAKKLQAEGTTQVRAIATSAIREAANQRTFLKQVKKAAGLQVEVVTGVEEARLMHVAIARRIPMDQRPWLLVDLGGGSLEVALADKTGMLWSESHPMGTVRLLEEFRACEGEPEKFRLLIEETIGTLRISSQDARRIAGLAATGGNIEELARQAGIRDPDTKVSELTTKALRETVKRLAKASPQELAETWGLRPDRADVIVPAGMIYDQVARLAGVDVIHVPHVGVKEGVLFDLVDALAVRTDSQRRTDQVVYEGALGLGRRYHFDEAHAVQVSRLATSLFDQLAQDHGLAPRDRTILVAAAVLHDVGRFVSDRKHHKHSYYLVSESDIPGLTAAEVELVAIVARYHRKAEPKMSHAPYAKLGLADRERVDRIAGLLRVADALDRQHQRAVRSVKCHRPSSDVLELELAGNGDFTLEQWAVAHKGALFSRLLGLKIDVRKGAA